MKLRRERFTAEYLDPRRSFEPAPTTVEVRWDPLTGQSCRLLPKGSLPAPATHDLAALAEQTRDSCPFCADRFELETPRFPPAVWSDGRIRVGDAVLFPNLVPYAKWSSVSVYSPRLHSVPLGDLTPSLIDDNLAAQVEFGRAILAYDPASSWISISANHLPPSGSSIFHPHLQGSAHPVPTNAQRLFAELPRERLDEYVDRERDAGERFVAGDRIAWIASFAPAGLAEVRAVVRDTPSTVDLEREVVAELATGLSNVLFMYAELGYDSFNLALHGAAHSFLVVRVVARAYFGPLQRSDVMWSERLHAETATDLWPETLAERARAAFTRAP